MPPCPPGYKLLQKVGSGGMGEVWKARDLQLGRHVAIKYLRAIASDEDLARFRREAETSSRLNHPGITRIFTVGQEQGRSFIVMQYVEGRTLAQWPQEDPRERVRFVRDAALAVDHAHAHGVLHRDVKPSNILLEEPTEPGRKERNVVVTDFGLAKWLVDSSPLTHTGQAVGTPAYMPPEQVLGGETGRRGDVYSLGATLYEVLAGRPPYSGDNALQILRKVVDEDPPPLEGELGAVVAKAMERNPQRRYATAGEFAEDLDRWLDRQRVRAPRIGPLLRWRRRLARRKPLVTALVAGLLLSIVVRIGSTGSSPAAIPAAEAATAKVNELLLAWVTGRPGREEVADRVVRTLEAAIDRDPLPESWLWLGRCRRMIGRESASCWEEALRRSPDFREALLEQARDRRIAAGRNLGGQFGRHPGPVERTDGPRDELLTGFDALLRGDAEPAETALSTYLQAVAWDGLGYALRAQARRLQRKFADAESDGARAVELLPKDAWVAFLNALIHHDQSRFSAEEREYSRAIDLDPAWAEARVARGLLYAEQRRPEKAEADLRGAIDRNPRDGASLVRLGEVLMDLERWTEAEAVFTRAIHLNGADAAAWRGRARLYRARNQLAAADADWTKAIAAEPSNPKSYEERGNVRRDSALHAQAIEDWRKAIELDARLHPLLAPRIEASLKLLPR
jgi:tetratricopeptide (TPR) repeat protein/predicted Ser/Thr protein kinase